MKYVLGLTAALALSVSVVSADAAETGVPTASAEGWASVQLTSTQGWKVLESGYWYMRGAMPGAITVDITNRSTHDVSDLYLRISFPPDKLEVTGYEGEYWTCWDVVGDPGSEGLDCTTNGFLAVPGEAFPTLKLSTKGWENHSDTFDVYAQTTGENDVHVGVPYRIDTST